MTSWKLGDGSTSERKQSKGHKRKRVKKVHSNGPGQCRGLLAALDHNNSYRY